MRIIDKNISVQNDLTVHRKWKVFRSRYIPAMLPILFYWSWPVKDIIGKDVGLVVSIWNKGQYQAIWEEQGYQAIQDYSLNFLCSPVRNLRDVREKGIKAGQKVVDICKEFAVKVDSATFEDFVTFFKLFDKTYNEFTKQSMLLWLFSGDAIQTEIKKELLGMNDEERGIIFSERSVPEEQSYSQEEEERFWKIVTQASSQGVDSPMVEREIREFSEEYFWFPYEYVGPAVWDVSTVKKRVIDALQSDIAENMTGLRHGVTIKISDEAEKLFAVLRTVILMQDDRKMLNTQICYYLNNVILGVFAKEFDISREDARYLEPHLFDVLMQGSENTIATKEELKSRSDFCVVVQDAEKYQVYSGHLAKEKLKELGIQEEIHKTGDVLQGQSAYRGKVTGHVKILHSSSEEQDFSDGDILVTGMTTPDFISIIKKAAAIITDEGGITCHAAIMARELKKPCIIGTKFATQILKDGDLVEVDADKGVVRILERVGDKK